MVKLLIKAPAMCCAQQGQKSDMTSYPVVTGSAIVGLLNSIHGKPEFNWAVRSIKVLNKIDRVRMKFNGRDADGSHSPVCSDFIANVSYIITAEAIIPDYPDNNKLGETVYLRRKHEETLLRRVVHAEARGRRGAYYLGRHSCHCTVEVAPEVEPKSYYEGRRPMVFRCVPFVQSFTPVSEAEAAIMGVGEKGWYGGKKVVVSPHDGKLYFSHFHYTDFVMVNGVINIDPRLYEQWQTNCTHHSQSC